MSEFQEFGKIYRWSREIVITEKIDGTNAQVFIQYEPHSNGAGELTDDGNGLCVYSETSQQWYGLYAGSRNRWITPKVDNFGFARWAWENAAALVDILGEGRHFGEWWGNGIQRGYGQTMKRWSLFNVSKWGWLAEPEARAARKVPDALGVVPVICRGVNAPGFVESAVETLAAFGSQAAPGFMKPEGVVIFHVPSGHLFKKTIQKDEEPKGKR